MDIELITGYLFEDFGSVVLSVVAKLNSIQLTYLNVSCSLRILRDIRLVYAVDLEVKFGRIDNL